MQKYSLSLFLEINNSQFTFLVAKIDDQNYCEVEYKLKIPLTGIMEGKISDLDNFSNSIKKNVYLIDEGAGAGARPHRRARWLPGRVGAGQRGGECRSSAGGGAAHPAQERRPPAASQAAGPPCRRRTRARARAWSPVRPQGGVAAAVPS